MSGFDPTYVPVDASSESSTPTSVAAKLYSDLGKTAKKLLNDDFVYDRKVQVKSTTHDGISYSVTGIQESKTDEIEGNVSLEMRTFGQKLITKLYTSGQATAELKLEDLDVKGLKGNLLTGIGKKIGVFSADYVTDRIACSSGLNYFAGPSVYGSLSVAAYRMILSGETEYDTKKREFKKYNCALSYVDGKESEMTVHLLDKGKTGKLSYAHTVSPKFSVAAEFLYQKDTDAKLLTMGIRYDLDPVTTVKGKLDTAGLVSLSYIQTIRPQTTLVMSSKFNVDKLDSASHRVGFSVVID